MMPQRSRLNKAMHRCWLNVRTGQRMCPPLNARAAAAIKSGNCCKLGCVQRGVTRAKSAFKSASACAEQPGVGQKLFILAGLVLVLGHIASFFLFWSSFGSLEAYYGVESVVARYERSPDYESQMNDPFNEKYTLVTQVYSRPYLSHLQAFVSNYTRSEHVAAVVFVWNCPFQEPPNQADILSHVPVRFVMGPRRNSMNNRFKAGRPAIKTKCICLIDDDLLISMEDVDRLFEVWKSYPSRLVGFLPRSYNTDFSNTHHYEYNRADKTYAFILVGASMFHRSYMADYWSPRLQPMRQYVDRVFNCDDVLMNMIVANKTNAPPIQVYGNVVSIMNVTMHGLSESGNWLEARDNCLNDLVSLFGREPFQWNKFMIEPTRVEHNGNSGQLAIDAANTVDTSYDGYCGELKLQEMDLTPVTAVINTDNAEAFDPIIISKLMSYRWITEIIVVSWSQSGTFSAPLMEYTPISGAKLRLLSGASGAPEEGDWGRYHGCNLAENTVCYMQDDSVIPQNLDALRSAYMGNPEVHHVVLPPDLVSNFRDALHMDALSGMFTVAIPLGHGVMMSRASAREFMQALFRPPRVVSRRFADMSYGISQNVVPSSLVMEVAFVNDSLSEANHRQTHWCWTPYSAERSVQSAEKDAQEARSMCIEDIEVTTTLTKALLLENRVPGRIDIPADVHAHLVHYGASDENRFFYRSTLQKEWPAMDFKLYRALDGDLETEWTMEYTLGDFFGLDLLKPMFVDKVFLHANDVDTTAWTVEHSCDMKTWLPSAPLLDVSTVNFDERQTVVLRTKKHGTLFARAVRFRMHRTPHRQNGVDNAFGIREIEMKQEEDLLLRQAMVFIISTKTLGVGSYTELVARSGLMRRALAAAAQQDLAVDVVFIDDDLGGPDDDELEFNWHTWLTKRNVRMHRVRYPFHKNMRGSGFNTEKHVYLPDTQAMKDAYGFMRWIESSELIEKAQVVHFDAAMHEMYFVLQRKKVLNKLDHIRFVAHVQATALLGIGPSVTRISGCATADDFLIQFMGRNNIACADKIVVSTRRDANQVLAHMKTNYVLGYSHDLSRKVHVLPLLGLHKQLNFTAINRAARQRKDAEEITPFLTQVLFVERPETNAVHVEEFVRFAHAVTLRLREVSPKRQQPPTPDPKTPASSPPDGQEGVPGDMAAVADDARIAGQDARVEAKPCFGDVAKNFNVTFIYHGKNYAGLIKTLQGRESVKVVTHLLPVAWVPAAQWAWNAPDRYIYYVASTDGMAAQRITDVLESRIIPFVPVQYEDLVPPKHRGTFLYHHNPEATLIRLLNRASKSCRFAEQVVSGLSPMIHEVDDLAASQWVDLHKLTIKDGVEADAYAEGLVPASRSSPSVNSVVPLITVCLHVTTHNLGHITRYMAHLEALSYPRIEVLVYVPRDVHPLSSEAWTFRGDDVQVVKAKEDAQQKRSTLVGLAHGEFIMLLEVDTLLRPENLWPMVRWCAKQRCDVVSGWLETLEGKIVIRSGAGEACGMMKNCVGSINAMLFRRKALVDFGLFFGASSATSRHPVEGDPGMIPLDETDWLTKFAMAPGRRMSMFPKVVGDVLVATMSEPDDVPLSRSRVDFMLNGVSHEQRGLWEVPLQR